ncbi:hemicentin-1-like isoform X2 [Rhopilema esculentum]|uniref:hemicentin-1-like isoform X2 n=1 Tax=Rhopilema esculentum TaxID=499914 RepID=UPI0031E07563|eukprot:gene4489-20734_t
MGPLILLSILMCCFASGDDAESNWRRRHSNLTVEESVQLAWDTLMKIYDNIWGKQQPSGKFYEAAIQITKEVATAHAAAQRSPDEAVDVKKLVQYMKAASSTSTKDLARSALARTLYGYFKAYLSGSGSKFPLGLNSISFAAAHFLETLRDEVGERSFNRLVARGGAKTLAFAIDTTGSMTDDIKAAKAITKAILAEERKEKVDFILSPFADPAFGPVVYKTESEGKAFIEAIDSIKPKGGGDCSELAFAGILEALNAGPQYGSPLFVITDASAKDDTLTNVKTAKVIAQSTGITVNFFTKPGGCDKKGIQSFRDLAAFTSGQVFPLKSDKELRNLTSFVKDSLDSTQIISISRTFLPKKKSLYKNKRRSRSRRSKGVSQFPLQVDEFAFKLQVTVTTERETTKNIRLLNPKGHIIQPLVNLSHSLVYKIEKPMMGEWILFVPTDVGKFDYIARVKSSSVIEFGYYYVLDYNGISSPVAHPLTGERCKVFVTIGGAHHTSKKTLSLRLIDPQGHTLQKDIRLKSIGMTGTLFQATFQPPSVRYKIMLEGNTLSGTKFTRVSRKEDEAKSILLRVLYGQNHFTVVQGKRFLLLAGLHNTGQTEFFKVRAFSNAGTAKVMRGRVMCRKGRMGFIMVNFKASKRAPAGQAASIFLLAKGERSGRFVTEMMRVLIVAE